MAQVSQVRTVNSAWFKSNGRRPSRQSPQEQDAAPQNETDDTAAPSVLDDTDTPPRIDEYV